MNNSPVASTPTPETKLCDGYTVTIDDTAFATREPQNITGIREPPHNEFHPGIASPERAGVLCGEAFSVSNTRLGHYQKLSRLQWLD